MVNLVFGWVAIAVETMHCLFISCLYDEISKFQIICEELSQLARSQKTLQDETELESPPRGIAIVSGPTLDIGPSRKVENDRRNLLVELGLCSGTSRLTFEL